MGDSGLPGSLSAVALLMLLAGCSIAANPGAPSPALSFAQQRGTLNETDAEREMQARVARFLVMAHAGRGAAPQTQDYYLWLTTTQFRSSRTRFRALRNDIAADVQTIPAAFAAICDVRNVDRQRALALGGLGLEGEMGEATRRRADANEATIARFTAALGFRHDAYAYALDRLLVETPHEEAIGADARLGELAALVDRAGRSGFCAPSAVPAAPLELDPAQAPILPQTSSDRAAS